MSKEDIENIEQNVPENEQPQDRTSRKQRKLAEQIKSLQQELESVREAAEKSKQENSDFKDQYLRLQAEWDNYRRRTAKERLELIDNAGRDFILGLLPVVDDCQRALDVLRKSDASEAAIEGTTLIYTKLIAYLNQRGVAPIEAIGTPFDTDYHEAVAQFPVEDPEKKNTVIDVTQQGYTLNGKVIRYAKVVVGI